MYYTIYKGVPVLAHPPNLALFFIAFLLAAVCGAFLYRLWLKRVKKWNSEAVQRLRDDPDFKVAIQDFFDDVLEGKDQRRSNMLLRRFEEAGIIHDGLEKTFPKYADSKLASLGEQIKVEEGKALDNLATSKANLQRELSVQTEDSKDTIKEMLKSAEQTLEVLTNKTKELESLKQKGLEEKYDEVFNEIGERGVKIVQDAKNSIEEALTSFQNQCKASLTHLEENADAEEKKRWDSLKTHIRDIQSKLDVDMKNLTNRVGRIESSLKLTNGNGDTHGLTITSTPKPPTQTQAGIQAMNLSLQSQSEQQEQAPQATAQLEQPANTPEETFIGPPDSTEQDQSLGNPPPAGEAPAPTE
ncbi:MAG: hypothetical protein WC045_01565 [Patescibacteria group bacterium]